MYKVIILKAFLSAFSVSVRDFQSLPLPCSIALATNLYYNLRINNHIFEGQSISRGCLFNHLQYAST